MPPNTPAEKPPQQPPGHLKPWIGAILLAMALASSAGAGSAWALSLDPAVAPLLGLSGHAWMGLGIWAFLRRRLADAG